MSQIRTFKEAFSFQRGLSKDVYIFNLVRLGGTTASTPYYFAYIASDRMLCFISVTSPLSNPSITSAGVVPNAHHPGITCLVALETSAGVFTAGGDGKVNLWVSETRNFLRAHPDRNNWQAELTVSTPNGQGISALAVDEDQKLIAAGTESEKEGLGEVAIYIWSYANADSPQLIRSYTESHTDTITSLQFHHTAPFTVSTSLPALTLISSSTDSLISIFDPTQDDEDDALLTVFNNKAAVSHLCPFQMPPSLPQSAITSVPALCSISHDEKLSVYEVEDTTSGKNEDEAENEDNLAPVWPELDLRETLVADYAIRLLPRQTKQQSHEMILAVGAYRPETLARSPEVNGPMVALYSAAPRLVDGKIEGFACVARLAGAHGEDVVRDIWFDEDAGFMLTCGEDAFVRLWVDQSAPTTKVADTDVEMEESNEVKPSVGKTDREERRKQKRKGDRHKPY